MNVDDSASISDGEKLIIVLLWEILGEVRQPTENHAELSRRHELEAQMSRLMESLKQK